MNEVGKGEEQKNVILKTTRIDEGMVWNRIHGGLESGGSILQANWHDSEFRKAVMGAKNSFLDVRWVNANLVITSQKVQFREKKALCNSSNNHQLLV